jgi:hypothetical protein
VTVGPMWPMVDMSAPTGHAANPNLDDFSRQHPLQQSARCYEPVPRAQLGSQVRAVFDFASPAHV